jgi:hypothetical protein
MEGSVATVEVLYPGYRRSPVTTQKSRYDQFPRVTHCWGTKHPIPDKDHPLLAEEAGPPTSKELNPGVIHTSAYPTSINMGGQDFTTCQPSPPHFPSSGYTRAPRSHTWGLSVLDNHQWSRLLGKQRHLMHAMTRHGNSHPHAPEVGT